MTSNRKTWIPFILGSLGWSLFLACQPPPAVKSVEAPSRVENPRAESDLTTITLTPQAVERLGIETAEVVLRSLGRAHSYAGELMTAPGRSVIVTAPLGGTLAALDGGEAPRSGDRLRKGQPVFGLVPLTPPDQDFVRLEAESLARAEAARLQSERAEQLLLEGAGSVRQAEQARAELKVAEANLQASRRQLDLLRSPKSSGGSGALAIEAPFEGRLGEVFASPGHTVAASAPLFEVSAEDPLWIRVPVYVGELASLDLSSSAEVHRLGVREDPLGRAQPIVGPPSANPEAATADVFYEIENDDGALRPGRKVGVSVPVLESGGVGETSPVVALTAVLYDIDGGTWVYQVKAPQVFQRRRVEVSHTVDDWAVLSRGPAVGSVVVVTGAAELFGTEFEAGH